MKTFKVCCLKQKKIGRDLLMGLQHAFAMFGSVILVPKLLGLDISVINNDDETVSKIKNF